MRGIRLVLIVLAACMAGVLGAALARAEDGQQPGTVGTGLGERVIDTFDEPSAWEVRVADGVTLKASGEPAVKGRDGKCLRLDYDFTRGSGYGIVRRRVDLNLPANYRFSYWIRGEGPSNTVEFKLVDRGGASGENVWWANQRDFAFPTEWERVTLPKRKIVFAWGPTGGAKPLERVGFIEIAITSFNGGHGTVWLDDLEFEPLPEVTAYAGTPMVSDASVPADHERARTIGADGVVDWDSPKGASTPALRIDFGQARELGGVVIEWGERFAADYDVLASTDGSRFVAAASVRGSNGGRDYVQMPDATARAIEVRVVDPANGKGEAGSGVSIHSLRFMGPEFGDSANEVLKSAAADAPRGWWPRYLRGEAAYWTVVGADADEKEALVSEDGAVEVDKLGFSLEPFVYEGGVLRTWNDGTTTHALEDGCLPIPSVMRSDRGLDLEIKAYTRGKAGDSDLVVRYELRNGGSTRRAGKLFVAIRPLQVNPTYQNLNITGGATSVRHIVQRTDGIGVDDRVVVPLVSPDGFGATTFDGGEIVEHLATGALPGPKAIDDPRSLGSAAIEYTFDLEPGTSRVVAVLVPFHTGDGAHRGVPVEQQRLAFVDQSLAEATAFWESRVGRVEIRLPKEQQRLVDSVRANLGYILVNRDGAGLQPGSRCYERTWIRDGALTSAALLSMGLSDEVRDFLDWFAPFQDESGKIPCCVDKRGPDPVPENDSHGEYITAVRNYYAYTHDEAFLRRHWPRVLKAAGYIETLRNTRMTPEYASGPDERRVLYGLMPESISHEGYSAKPMHSYWDDFWTLKGLRDAAAIAEIVGDREQSSRLAALHASFAHTLNDSIRLATKMKGIDFVPGCAELGDFDATSTTVALFPCGWEPGDLRGVLEHTFDRYWKFFEDRRDGKIAWKDYTPYEERIVGSMVLLGHRDRAVQMLDFFFDDQRPAEWREWAEVVRLDPREPGYIGDMPHTWVGSDFINSVRLMLAYTRESDGALVIGAGLPRSWLESAEGVAVDGMCTEFGRLSFEARAEGGAVRFEVKGLDRPPRASVWVSLPQPDRIDALEASGSSVAIPADGLVRLGPLPAMLKVRYRSTDGRAEQR